MKTKRYKDIEEQLEGLELPEYILRRRKSWLEEKSRKCPECGKTFLPKRAKHFLCYECFNNKKEK